MTKPDVSFLPDAERAKQLDTTIKRRIAKSLEYIEQQSVDHINFPEKLFRQLLDRLKAGDKVSPVTFALYYDLIIAIEQDDLDSANQIIGQFSLYDVDTPEFGVRPLSPDEFGEQKYLLYRRFADCDQETPLNLIPPAPESFEVMKGFIEEAMRLIDTASPELGKEIRSLINEVVLAANQPNDEDSFSFGGVSSAYLWGAIVLNVNGQSVLQVAESIIHESAHMLLFALSMDGDMSQNAYDQRLSSPLREDLRPMEGIYHATYVLGRMYYGLKSILESGLINEEQRAEAENLIDQCAQDFKEGLQTVEESANLTETGQQVMAEAKQHMQQLGVL